MRRGLEGTTGYPTPSRCGWGNLGTAKVLAKGKRARAIMRAYASGKGFETYRKTTGSALVPQPGQNNGGPDFLRSLLHHQGSSSSRLVEPTRAARSNQGAAVPTPCHQDPA